MPSPFERMSPMDVETIGTTVAELREGYLDRPTSYSH